MSIPMYIISSIFRLLPVTHGQGSMSLESNTLFMFKLHPGKHASRRLSVEFTPRKLRKWLQPSAGLVPLVSHSALTLVTTLHHLNTNPRQVENLDSVDLVSIQMQIVKSSLENVFAKMFLLFVYSERCEFLQARVCLLSEASLPLNWDYQWLMGLDGNPIATPATACTANIH